ncbi:contact-dependent growth inhibition system immunity protein [Streptomyces virginiae]|uniref:contact-dependent growth inhibition system immunity protein n=1 Tax=Streptomyces virginiae TaxID=1961 RepID=UPI0038058B81
MPPGELRPADLRTLVTPRVAPASVLPLAVLLLVEEPLLAAYFYEGDPLLATGSVPAAAWAVLPEFEARLRAAVERPAGAAVDELPRGGARVLARFAGRG